MNRNSFLILLMSAVMIIQGAEQEVEQLREDHTAHHAIHGIIDTELPRELVGMIADFIGLAPYVRKCEITQAFDEARNRNAELNSKSRSPDWSLLASCEGTNAKIHQKNILLAHPDNVTAVCWVSDKLLATGSEDRRVRVWDVPLRECFATGLGNYSTVRETMRVGPHPWLTRKKKYDRKIYENAAISSLCFHDNTLIIGDTDGKLYRWEFASKYLPEFCTAAKRDQLQQNKETKCIVQ